MPQMDGYDLLGHVRELAPEDAAPLIALTAPVSNRLSHDHVIKELIWRMREPDAIRLVRRRSASEGFTEPEGWLCTQCERREVPCEILKETPHRFLVRLGKDCLLPGGRQASKGAEGLRDKGRRGAGCRTVDGSDHIRGAGMSRFWVVFVRKGKGEWTK
jgi:hypothetical protein